MGIKSFVALWSHRFRKYSHIAEAHIIAYQRIRYFSKLKKANPKKRLVAVVRTEHFGDIVALEPLSRHVRNLYPDAHIVWFVKPVFRELVEVNPHVDEVLQEFCATQRQVIFRSGVFDIIHELQFRNNNHCPTCQEFYENPVAVRKNINVENYFKYGNLLEVFALSGDLTLPVDQHPRLYLQPKHREKVDTLKLPESYIVVHCQSNFAPKDWPASKWEKLINWLLDHYPYAVVEVGLSSNLDINRPEYFNLTGKLSILETAEVIRRADFFIGLDSGPAHLANAADTYGFVLMGSLTNFDTYNPYSGHYGSGQNCTIIREKGMPCAQLSEEKVLNAIRSVLPAEITTQPNRHQNI